MSGNYGLLFKMEDLDFESQRPNLPTSQVDVSHGISSAPKRALEPAKNSLSGPENYQGSSELFMRGEVAGAYEQGLGVALTKPSGPSMMLTSSLAATWGAEPKSVAVSGLHGCTSVIAVSRRGVWAAHFCDVPSFTGALIGTNPPRFEEGAAIEARFQKEVLLPLHKGSLSSPHHQAGIQDLRGGDILGGCGDVLDNEAAPRVFVYTPRAEPASDELRYPQRVEEMVREIRRAFGVYGKDLLPVEVVPYDMLSMADMAKENDLVRRPQDPDFLSPKCKVLVQYQPAAAAAASSSTPVDDDVFGEANGDGDGGVGATPARYRLWFAGELHTFEDV